MLRRFGCTTARDLRCATGKSQPRVEAVTAFWGVSPAFWAHRQATLQPLAAPPEPALMADAQSSAEHPMAVRPMWVDLAFPEPSREVPEV